MPAGTGGVFTPAGTLANLTGTATARHDRLCDGTAPARCSTAPTKPIPRGCAPATYSVSRQRRVQCLPSTGHRLDPDPDAARDRGRPAGQPSTIPRAGQRGHHRRRRGRPAGELAGLCRDQGLWLHVDSAHGAAAARARAWASCACGTRRRWRTPIRTWTHFSPGSPRLPPAVTAHFGCAPSTPAPPASTSTRSSQRSSRPDAPWRYRLPGVSPAASSWDVEQNFLPDLRDAGADRVVPAAAQRRQRLRGRHDQKRAAGKDRHH